MSIEFTVEHDHTVFADEGEEQLIGDISFTVQTRPGDFQLRNQTGPTPRTINLPRRTGYLALDGRLYKDSTSGEPFRLPANDPIYNLDHITYRADFNLTTLIGESIPVRHTYFPAPSTDTTLYLTKVMKDPDQTVMEVRAKVYAEDILDVGGVGEGVIKATSAADARTALGIDLIDLDDWDWYDEFADFPPIGTTDIVYGDLATGALYRWSGSAYVIATQDIAARTNLAPSKAIPVDADQLPLVDSEASNGLKKLTWGNAKADLNKVYRRARNIADSNGADDRAAIQAVLDEGPGIVVFRKGGTWIVDPTGQASGNMLKPQSNTTIIVEEGATIQVKDNALSQYALFCLDNVDNVTIRGAGTLQGDSPTHTGSTGSYGHLILITNGSSSCRVLGPLLLKWSWGDGIYIGGTAICSNIIVDGVTIEDCRRQGVGPYWVDGCIVRNCRIFDIGLTGIDYVLCNAMAIDIEPNAAQVVNHVLIENNDVSTCRGSGIAVLGHFGTVTDVIVRGNRVDGCGYDSNVTLAGIPHGLIVKSVADSPQIIDNAVTNSGYAGGTALANLDVRLSDGPVVRGGYYGSGSGPGIYVDTCTFATIDGATVDSSTHYGVLLNGSDDTLVTGCNLLDNCQDGAGGTAHLHIFNGDRTVVRGNTFRGSLATAWVATQDATVVDTIVANNIGVGTAPTVKVSDAGTNTALVGNVRKGTGVYENWSTADRLTAGTVELGAASDTTIARSAAGRVTVEGAEVITATSAAAVDAKATPVDADTVVVFDSAASGAPKKTTWANIKATLAAWLGLLPSGTVIALHNQTDQVTNYERARHYWSSNVYTIQTDAGGTGTVRDINITAAGAVTAFASTQTATVGTIRLRANLSAANGCITGVNGTLSASTGLQYGLSVSPTINQTSTAGYTALLINPTETGTGSGAKKPLVVQVGGVEKFAVDNAGNVTPTGRITPRVGTVASSATPTINTDAVDAYSITAQAAAITSMTTNLTGTPVNFQRLVIRIKDSGSAQTIAWGASFQSGSVALPTTTVAGKTLLVGFIYDSVDAKWTCEASGSRA